MSNDYASTILNLQQRVAYMENTIGYLMNEVQRVSQNKMTIPAQAQAFQTSIPIQPTQTFHRPYAPRETPIYNLYNGKKFDSTQPPRFSNTTTEDATMVPIALSEILRQGEEVVFGIHTGRDEAHNLVTSTVTATFDGTDLTITQSPVVPQLIGFKSSKPGEILFKFMNLLKTNGVIQRTFNALPWRLASVTRNGQRLTLSQLRHEKQGTIPAVASE